MSSKYYTLLYSDKIEESILHEHVGGWSFEDHYWHMACLAYYYKNLNDDDVERKCLSELTDLNYAYNAFCFFDSYGVLPLKYKYVTKPFENSMVDKKIEDEINRHNKLARKKSNKKYWLSSLATLIIIPLMLFLMLVCKLDSNTSIIISIIVLLFIQTLTSPWMENTKFRIYLKARFSKKKEKPLPQELNEYFKYLDRFLKIVNNEYYVALTRAKDENEAKELAKTIKEKNLNL